MKNILFSILIILSLNVLPQNNESFSILNPINGVKLFDNTSLTIIIDNNQPHISVSGNYIQYNEVNGILEFRGNSTATLLCPSGQVKEVDCRNKSKISLSSLIKSDSLNISSDDYGQVNVSVMVGKLTLRTKDYSVIKFNGHTGFASIEASDFSKVTLASSERLKYQAGDFASLKACALSEVNGKSDGFAKVTLSGNPLTVNIEVKEFSKVSRTNQSCISNVAVQPLIHTGNGNINYNKRDDNNNDDDGEDEGGENDNKPKYKSRKKRYSWQGVSAGINAIVNESHSFGFDKKYEFFEPNYSSSFNFQLNPFQQSFYIYERNIAFLTGIGIEWRIFGLRRKSYIAPDTSYFHGYIDTTSGFTLKKNNLRNFNLQIPLLFDFRFGKKNRFSFMTGIVGTWMLLSSQKIELTNNGYEYEIVKKDQFNLNPLQLKAHASMGYRDVHFFGEYAFNGMFLKNRGPSFRFLTVGIRYSFDYD